MAPRERTGAAIGVMPKGFEFPYGGGEMWTPFVIDQRMKQDHGNHYLRAIALLKPGATIAQANVNKSSFRPSSRSGNSTRIGAAPAQRKRGENGVANRLTSLVSENIPSVGLLGCAGVPILHGLI